MKLPASSQLGKGWGKAGSAWEGRGHAGVSNQDDAEAAGVCMLILEGMLDMNSRVLGFYQGEPECKEKNDWDVVTV